MLKGLRLEGRRYEVRSGLQAGHRSSAHALCLSPFLRSRPHSPSQAAALRNTRPSRAPPPPLQVHRFHPPLLYGRAMLDCEPEASTGIAACRVERSRFGSGPCYVVVTYEQPHTSARVVPRLVAFAEQHLEAP